MTYRKILALAALAAALVVVGCASVQSQWKTAVATNTFDSYQNFAEKHAKSTYADSARLAIVRLKFEAADKEHTVGAYHGFIKENPKSSFVAKAEERIDELEFKVAADLSTIPGYMDFIAQHPASHHVAAARQNLDKLRIDMYAKEPAVAQGILARYPAAARKGEIPAKYVGNWVFRHIPDGTTTGYLIITSSYIIGKTLSGPDQGELVFKPGNYEIGAKGSKLTARMACATTAKGDTIKIPIPVTLTAQPAGLKADFGQGQVTVKGKLTDFHVFESIKAVQIKNQVQLTEEPWDWTYLKAGAGS